MTKVMLFLFIITVQLCFTFPSELKAFSYETLENYNVEVIYKTISSNTSTLKCEMSCVESQSDKLVFKFVKEEEESDPFAILTYTLNCSTNYQNYTVVALAHIAQENLLYYFDAANSLYSYQTEKGVLTKIAETTSPVISMTVDWITRTIYWAEAEKSGDIIYSLYLNNLQSQKTKVYESENSLNSLVVSPFDRKLLWMESKNLQISSKIYFWNMNYKTINWYHLSVCKDVLDSTAISSLMFTTSRIKFSATDSVQHSTLTYVDESNGNFIAEKLETGECHNFGHEPVVFNAPSNSKIFSFDQQIFSDSQ